MIAAFATAPLLAWSSSGNRVPASHCWTSKQWRRNQPPVPKVFILALLLFTSTAAADTINLRSGERIDDCTVTAVDEDGLHLSEPRPGGAKTIRLDEVESAKIAADKQAALDQLLRELGDPLFRIRWRLTVGDVGGLAEPAEAVYPRYRGRRSPTALLVAVATMRGRIHERKRELAAEPMLQIVEILRSGAASPADLPGEARLTVDPTRGVSGELLPIWFDAEAAQAALPEMLATIRAMRSPRPEGVRIYYGSLAAQAGDEATAKQMLDDLRPSDPLVEQLLQAVQAHREISRRPDSRQVDGTAVATLTALADENKIHPTAAPLALYVVGLARAASTDSTTASDGVLDLLKLPALYARADRELAAAALYQAAQTLSKLKDEASATAVRRELTTRFGNSLHAERLK